MLARRRDFDRLERGTAQKVIGSIIGTRRDQAELLEIAVRYRIRPVTEVYPLARANEALGRLRNQEVRLRAVLTPS